jgi:hypothetical protein
VAPAKRKPFSGKLARAAIFAGAIAGTAATAACGPEPAPQNPDQQHNQDQNDRTDGVNDGVDGDQTFANPPPDRGPADAGPVSDEVPDEPYYDPNNQPKPYGAPPARHRIV